MIKKVIPLLLLSLGIAHAEPQNLSFVRQELIQYHDSGHYIKEFKLSVDRARTYLKKRLDDNKHAPNPRKLAIVLDIDETSLSNYGYMVKRDFGGTKEMIHREENKGDAPVLKPMLSLYRYAKSHGVAVFFVTGRREYQRRVTRLNLKRAGYNNWQGLYLKPNNYHKKSVIPYKVQARQSIEEQGYDIVMSMGDQYSDFRGGHTEKGFKLPNPYYYLP